MNHPYAPWIIAALASGALAALTLTWSLVRRDRREAEQHEWERVTHATPDELLAMAVHQLAKEGDQNR